MACEVNNKEINSQCAELLVRPTYLSKNVFCKIYLTKNLSFSSDVVFCFIGVLEMPKKFS